MKYSYSADDQYAAPDSFSCINGSRISNENDSDSANEKNCKSDERKGISEHIAAIGRMLCPYNRQTTLHLGGDKFSTFQLHGHEINPPPVSNGAPALIV